MYRVLIHYSLIVILVLKKGHVAHFPCILSIVDPILAYYTRSDLGQLKLVHFNLQTTFVKKKKKIFRRHYKFKKRNYSVKLYHIVVNNIFTLL